MPDFLTHASYLGITVAIILTGMGLPVPEEILVIGAGIASNTGDLEPLTALAACLVGAVAGDCVSYAIGYHFGRALLRDRHWFSRLLTIEREQKVEKLFQKHGLKAFLVARFMIGIRSPMYMTAGILRISFRWFVLVDAISAAIVVSLFFGLSFIFAAGFKHLWEKLHGVEVAVSFGVIPVAVGVGIYWYLRRRRKQKETREASPDVEGPCEAVDVHVEIDQQSPARANEIAPEEAQATAGSEQDVAGSASD
ncbi:MAG TPA: DedA family protein [Pirellulales bacterium]|jgi:membrane protein DedA with SNARE-associated domain|nr:DedA family protein [Pirellulales bacterium]